MLRVTSLACTLFIQRDAGDIVVYRAQQLGEPGMEKAPRARVGVQMTTLDEQPGENWP